MDAEKLYEDKSYLVMIAVGCAVAITCVAVTLRLLARRLQKVPLGADDYVIMVGAIFTIGTAITFYYSGQNGAGRHLKSLRPDELSVFWKATYAGYQTYGMAITLIKLSVLLFYQRIFSTPQFRLRTNIVGGLVVAWLFINNFMAAFQCRPIRKAWSPLTPGRCIDTLSLIIGLQAGNLFLDIVILTLPVHAVSQLQMSLAKKISVAAIFLLGGLSIVIATIRIVVIATADAEDVTWYTGIESWTAVEPAIEVLSVCLPIMAPFLHGRKFLRELRSSIASLLSFSSFSRLHGGAKKSADSLELEGKFHRIGNRRHHEVKIFDEEAPSEYRQPPYDGGRDVYAAVSAVAAEGKRREKERDGELDGVPLHSIKVTDRVDVH